MDTNPWRPPSDQLLFEKGLWRSPQTSTVSYPETGNDVCFQVEDSSYWFQHRNQCLLALLKLFPPAGTLFDVGGGNGFVTSAMQKDGYEAVLVEPGNGARNALKRGVGRVVMSTLENAGFYAGSLPAVGAFDVLEHIENDVGFIESIRRLLVPGGRFYCTVPAFPVLWSGQDIHAGHHRRYTRTTLCSVLRQAGFEVQFMSYFFSWLTLPVLGALALPFRIRGSAAGRCRDEQATKADHTLPWGLAQTVHACHRWELFRLGNRRRVPFGTSVVCIAGVPMK